MLFFRNEDTRNLTDVKPRITKEPSDKSKKLIVKTYPR